MTTHHHAPHRNPATAQLETWARAAVVAVSTAAAAASFFALYWVGHAVLGWPMAIAALFPLAVDGLAMVAAVATVLFAGHRGLRAFAWFVFTLLLAVSLAGNVAHSLVANASDLLPGWLFTAFAAAPPVIVALGVHLYALISRNGAGVVEAATTEPVQEVATSAQPVPGAPAVPTARNLEPAPVAPVTEPATDVPLEVAEHERAAYAAWCAAADRGEPLSGSAIARLLHETGARDRVVSEQAARKRRDVWEGIRQAERRLVAVGEAA